MLRRIIPRAAAIPSRTCSRQILPLAFHQAGSKSWLARSYATGPKYSFSDEIANLGGPSSPFKLGQALQQDYDQLTIFHQGASAAPTPDEKKGFQNAFVWELARHTVAKELVVFPAVEENVAGGKEFVAKERAAQQEIKNLLADFQDMKPDDEQFMTKLNAVYIKYKDYTRNHEQDTIQKLESVLSLTQSKELCLSYERTKRFAPTRSHPNVSDGSSRGMFETVSAFVTAPVDKLRDLFRRFPQDGEGPGKDGSIRTGPDTAPYELEKKKPEERSV